MTNKEHQKTPEKISRGQFIGLSAAAIAALFLSKQKIKGVIEGIEMMFPDPQPPSDIELPPLQEEVQTSTPEPTVESESTQETQEIEEELDIEQETTPEASSTPEGRMFNPESDTKLENIDLTTSFVMDIPHKTGQSGGWGSLRYEVVPWFATGNSWGDPQNAEAIFRYENFSDGLDDAIVVPTQQEGSYVLMLHSYSAVGEEGVRELLSGDVWRRAVENHLSEKSDKEIIGESLSLIQDFRENNLFLTAFNATEVSAKVFNDSFVAGTPNFPMTCDTTKMGVPSSTSGQIHFIACTGRYVDDDYSKRYILSWESHDLASLFSSWSLKKA